MTTPADPQTSPHGPQARQESPPDDTTAAADAQPSPDDDATEDQPQEPPESDRTAANAEAARYRTALRKAEAERDALAERITAYQRQRCEDVIGQLLAQPADVWLFGDHPADFYDDGDKLAEDRLRAAVAGLLDMRPGLRKSPPQTRRKWGQYGSNPPGETGWGQVLKQ